MNRKIIGLAPTVGILIFILLYVYSSTLYPGGNQANINEIGFSWTHNYWCNLMNNNSINGMPNPAAPYAISAMISLCIGLCLFFFQFANKIAISKYWKIIIRVSGTVSMIFACFIFTRHHDLMTILSSLFGLVVVVGIIKEIYKSDMNIFKMGGVICILLLTVNNYIYYSHHLIEYLPIIQKITFTFILTWVVSLNIVLTYKNDILGLKNRGYF